jgi:hypothetical protein
MRNSVIVALMMKFCCRNVRPLWKKVSFVWETIKRCCGEHQVIRQISSVNVWERQVLLPKLRLLIQQTKPN